MKEAIQTLLKSDKMVHAFEYLKNDESHTIDQHNTPKPSRKSSASRR